MKNKRTFKVHRIVTKYIVLNLSVQINLLIVSIT